MIGFILAAGFGTRLKPLTDHIPKALVPVCGVPLLERNLSYVSTAGCDTLAINAHYLPEQIYTYSKESKYSFDIFHEKEAIRGTGGAYYFAQEFLQSDEMFCSVNVDLITTIDLKGIIDKFKSMDCICALIATPSNGKSSIYYEPTSTDYRGIPGDIIDSNGAVGVDYIGIALYRKEVLSYITKDDFSIVPVWKRLVERGQRVAVLSVDPCYWRDTGTPQSLASLYFDVLDQKISLELPNHLQIDFESKRAYPINLPVQRLASLHNNSWVESVQIPEGATIKQSIVLPGATIDEGENIEHTLVTKWGTIAIK